MNTRRCELLQERQTLHISTTRLLRSPAKQKCGDLFYNKSELLQQQSSKSFFLSPPLLPSFLPSVMLFPRNKNWLRQVLQYIHDNLLLHSKCCVIIITTTSTTIVVSSSSSSSHLSSNGCRVATTKTRTITLVRFLIPSGTKKKIDFLKMQSPFCLWARFEQDFILARSAAVSKNSERNKQSSVSIFVFTYTKLFVFSSALRSQTKHHKKK